MGKPSSLCFPPEPGEMTALGWCWSLCTTAALIFLGAGSEGVTHRQPIWRACFFPAYFNFWAVAAYCFPIELAAVVLCYTFNASSVCTCLFFFSICLVRLLRGMELQTETEAFPFLVRRDCIAICAWTRKANRKIRVVLLVGEGGERWMFYCYSQKLGFFVLRGFILPGKGAGQEKVVFFVKIC